MSGSLDRLPVEIMARDGIRQIFPIEISTGSTLCLPKRIYIYMCVCVCVCVCMYIYIFI